MRNLFMHPVHLGLGAKALFITAGLGTELRPRLAKAQGNLMWEFRTTSCSPAKAGAQTGPLIEASPRSFMKGTGPRPSPGNFEHSKCNCPEQRPLCDLQLNVVHLMF
jgi:hypothetical protein